MGRTRRTSGESGGQEIHFSRQNWKECLDESDPEVSRMLRPMALRMSRLVAEWWRVGFCQGNFQSETWKCLASIENNISIFLMFFCVAFWCFHGMILRQVTNRLSSDVFRSEISMFVIDATMWHYIIDLDTKSCHCLHWLLATLATCASCTPLENMEVRKSSWNEQKLIFQSLHFGHFLLGFHVYFWRVQICGWWEGGIPPSITLTCLFLGGPGWFLEGFDDSLYLGTPCARSGKMTLFSWSPF